MGFLRLDSALQNSSLSICLLFCSRHQPNYLKNDIDIKLPFCPPTRTRHSVFSSDIVSRVENLPVRSDFERKFDILWAILKIFNGQLRFKSMYCINFKETPAYELF